MDKSREVFINMCEKAEELQKLWEPKRGDIAYDVADNRNIWRSIDWHVITTAFTMVEGNRFHVDMYQDICKKEDYIWLPRQDQLQEMIVNPTLNISEFSKWALEAIENADYYMQFDSGEQLWLGFVMKKKFGKAWNGEEWE